MQSTVALTYKNTQSALQPMHPPYPQVATQEVSQLGEAKIIA